MEKRNSGCLGGSDGSGHGSICTGTGDTGGAQKGDSDP